MTETMPREEAIRLIESKSWYHRFEILPGYFTPGTIEFPAAIILDDQGIAKDLTGMRALDIGTWDGPLAFELERRGATVTAVDIQDPDSTGFNVAKRVLGSKVAYRRATVYELADLAIPEQDLVCFRGVYYHLKYPMLAFEKISSILKIGGLLYFEGECLLHYAEDLNGQRTDLDISALAASDVPLAMFCPGRFKDGSNWFVPNLACLKSILQTTGMELVRHRLFSKPDQKPYPAQRFVGLARKTQAFSETSEHPVYENRWSDKAKHG